MIIDHDVIRVQAEIHQDDIGDRLSGDINFYFLRGEYIFICGKSISGVCYFAGNIIFIAECDLLGKHGVQKKAAFPRGQTRNRRTAQIERILDLIHLLRLT